MILSGTPVTRELKSCFSEMMNQLGPKQLADLKKLGLAQLPSEPTSEPKVNFQKVADEN